MTDREEFIFKAAHLAGMLEQSKDIEVDEWDDLQAVIEKAIDEYRASYSGDFWEMIEAALRASFGRDIGR